MHKPPRYSTLPEANATHTPLNIRRATPRDSGVCILHVVIRTESCACDRDCEYTQVKTHDKRGVHFHMILVLTIAR